MKEQRLIKYFFLGLDFFLLAIAGFAIGTWSMNPESYFLQNFKPFIQNGNITDIIVYFCGFFVIYGVSIVARLTIWIFRESKLVEKYESKKEIIKMLPVAYGLLNLYVLWIIANTGILPFLYLIFNPSDSIDVGGNLYYVGVTDVSINLLIHLIGFVSIQLFFRTLSKLGRKRTIVFWAIWAIIYLLLYVLPLSIIGGFV